MKTLISEKRFSDSNLKKLKKALSYLENHLIDPAGNI